MSNDRESWADFPDNVRNRLMLGDLTQLWAAIEDVRRTQAEDKKDTNDRLGKVTAAFIGMVITVATAAISYAISARGGG